jgi:hypothetical protein
MGLSSSKTKTTSNTSQNSNQTENATTTPVTPDWLSQAAQDYVGRIGAFGDMDPNGFVAPAAPLQQMAWQNAGSLGDWRAQTASASQMAQQAGSGGPNYAGTGGAIGRWAGAAGLTPDVRMGNGMGSAPASSLGAKAMAGHPGELPRPAGQAAPAGPGAFGGAAGRQPGGAFTYDAPGIGGVAAPAVSRAATTALGAASLASAQGYQAPEIGAAHLVSGQGYTAPQLGGAQGYAAARIGTPIGAQTAAWQAPAIGDAQTAGATRYDAVPVAAAKLGPVANASATDANAASLLTNLDAYRNPYNRQVVDAAMGDFDNQAAQQRAALEARGARAGAFGGSRFGIAEGQLEGDLARVRATLESGLLSQGFDTAAGLSQADAANRQQAELFNAQNRTGVSLANAGYANQRDLSQAGFDMQGALANQQAGNEAAQAYAQAQNQAGMFNAQSGNARADLAAQLDAQARGQNAAALNAGNQQYAASLNARDLAQAGYDSAASQQFADTSNQFALQNAQLQAQAGQYNAGLGMQAALANQAGLNQYGIAQAGLNADAARYRAEAGNQAALANAAGQNQYGLAQFGADTQDAQNYAAAQNQAGLAGYQGDLQRALEQAQLQAQAGQYNAGARNQMSQFNAGQADNAANRALQAAGMLGGLANDYGAGTRADLGTMAQLGDQQRAIEQAYAMAGPAQLQLMGQLSGMTPYDILVGRNVNGTTNGQMTGTGTQVASQTPSMFSSLLQAAQATAAFVPPSDPRLKRGIEKIGALANGLGLYLYNYLWDGDRRPRVGVMADEVERIAPDALGPAFFGFRTVDYRRLGLAHLVEA